MARRAKTVCRKLGCNTLVETPGYCEDHQKDKSSFKALSEKKSPVTKKFYSSWRWTQTSKNFRAQPEHSLCEECFGRGISERGVALIQAAEMVHHEPPLEQLLAKGLDAHDPQYLHSLCNNCHLGHLRDMKNPKGQ